MRPAPLPYVDEHAIDVAVPRDQAWVALRRWVADALLTHGDGALLRLLGTDPPAGFAIAAATPPQRLELVGRHRFARYMLAFELTDAGAGTTLVCARTFADFPGVHGRAYRALVIGTGAHVVATRHLLRSIRRCALDS
ncbi:MAG: hypothetical protein ACXVFT_07465 [Solirubrobacteraceae bacterium]